MQRKLIPNAIYRMHNGDQALALNQNEFYVLGAKVFGVLDEETAMQICEIPEMIADTADSKNPSVIEVGMQAFENGDFLGIVGFVSPEVLEIVLPDGVCNVQPHAVELRGSMIKLENFYKIGEMMPSMCEGTPVIEKVESVNYQKPHTMYNNFYGYNAAVNPTNFAFPKGSK